MKFRILSIAALAVLVCSLAGLSVVSANHDGDDHGGGEFEFTGTVQSLPNTPGFIGDWMVGGKIVHVTSATRIEQEDDHEGGHVAVGATVQVEGTLRADGSVDATEIEVKEAEEAEVTFKGTIMSLPGTTGFIGDWMVGGKTVHVSSATRISQEDGPVVVGALVSVEGAQRADGSIDATRIEVLSNPGGDDGRNELEGVIQSLPNTTGFIGDWVVSGRTVHVTSATIIETEHGAVAVGAQVEVKGTLRGDGSIDAAKIEVKANEQDDHSVARLKGSIQSLPHSSDMSGDWVVSTTTVHVTSATRLQNEHGVFTVGGRVKVKGMQRADGSIDARMIKSRD